MLISTTIQSFKAIGPLMALLYRSKFEGYPTILNSIRKEYMDLSFLYENGHPF